MSAAPLLLSVEVALWATLIAGVLGVALASWLARARFAGRDIVDAVLTVPLVLPPTVLGYLLLHVVGRHGPVGRAWEAVWGTPLVFTPAAAVCAASIAALPLVVRSARAALEDVDARLLGAAATLGASRWRVWRTVELPLARGGIVAGLTLGFARALGEFGITLMIAGNIPGLTQTGALAIYDAVQAGREDDATRLALALALIGVACVALATALARRRPHAW